MLMGQAPLIVKGAYEKAVRVRYGRPIKAALPTSGKTLENALAFMQVAGRRKTSPEALMHEVLDYWGPDFCRKAFGRPWPPFNLAVSEKTRIVLDKQVVRSTPRKLATIDQYLDILSGMDPKDAIACVEAGWPEGPARIRKQLKAKLQGKEPESHEDYGIDKREALGFDE